MNNKLIIPISKLNISPTNTGDEAEIITIAESIKNTGLIQPIIVKENDDGNYTVVEGIKRCKAVILNGDNQIEAIVISDDKELSSLKLISARIGNHLSVIEEAEALKKLMADKKMTQSELAKKLKLSQSSIANKIRLLKLPTYIKNALIQEDISERHARALLKVKDEDLEKVFIQVLNKKYTVKQTENYIAELYANHKSNRGYAGNILIGINTIKQAIEMCKKSGLDCDFNEVNYQKEVKLTIRFKK
ncbi:MAG: ParB/RepB/Spo0J family partition protein [Erysipelotrichaceae bacterium]|nr:ParB/RepB/Spo0J family partition protein [Erysipelotrichaceae bacterium]